MATAWYYDGQQELMSVMRFKMPPNPLFVWLPRHIESQAGTYLRYGGKWAPAPGFGQRWAIFASNGVMLAGPKAPELDPAQAYILLQNGQERTLFTGQDILDAAQPVRKAGGPLLLSWVDASYDAQTGRAALSMNYLGNLSQGVKNYTCHPAEFLWDGSKLTMIAPEQLPYVRHMFAGGSARLSYAKPYKTFLVVTLGSAPGQLGSERVIDLVDPANKGFTRVAGIVGDSVWLSNILDQTVVRRDLRSWKIVEQRDLRKTMNSIPRKLLREMR